jgi:hypothetical protein
VAPDQHPQGGEEAGEREKQRSGKQIGDPEEKKPRRHGDAPHAQPDEVQGVFGVALGPPQQQSRCRREGCERCEWREQPEPRPQAAPAGATLITSAVIGAQRHLRDPTGLARATLAAIALLRSTRV